MMNSRKGKFSKLTCINRKNIQKIWEQSFESNPTQKCLEAVLKLYPGNKDIEEIEVKVKVINVLYSARLMATLKMSRHIHKIKGLSSILNNGESRAVDMIASLKLDKKTKTFYSFATKYCWWHNKNEYPIYDDRVERALVYCRDVDDFCKFVKKDFKKYNLFKEIIQAFRCYYNLTDLSYSKIDKFLWTLGNNIKSIKDKNKKLGKNNKEIKSERINKAIEKLINEDFN